MYQFNRDEQKLVHKDEDFYITRTQDQEQTILENQGFVSLDIPKLLGAKILDISYENVWYGENIETSNIIVTLRLPNNEIRLWSIQADEENNRGGYIYEYDINGEMVTNEAQGKRRKSLNA